MTKQDKMVKKIVKIIEESRMNNYSGGIQINFTNGYIANKLKFHNSKEILSVDDLQGEGTDFLY